VGDNGYINIGPGECIRNELKARKWSVDKFNVLTKIQKAKLVKILEDKIPMTVFCENDNEGI